MKLRNIPIVKDYINSFHLALHDDRDGRLHGRRGVFMCNISTSTFKKMVGGVFYSTLLLLLTEGIDAVSQIEYLAMIETVSTVTGLCQFLSPFIFERMSRRGPLILWMRALYYIATIFGLPLAILLPVSLPVRVAIFTASEGIASFFNAVVSPAYCTWHIYSLSEYCRSDYFTVVNLVTTIAEAVVGLTLGIFMDYFKANSQAMLGILIIRGVAILFAASELFFCRWADEPNYNQTNEKFRLADIILVPLKSKGFLACLGIILVYKIAFVFPGSFYNTYLLDENGANFSYTLMSVISFVCIPVSLLAHPLWNRLVHKFGWLKTMAVSTALNALFYAMNAFVTRDSQYIYLISNVFSQLVCCGMTLGMKNLPYIHMPKRMGSTCLAIFDLVGALGSTLAIRFARRFLLATDGKTLSMFGLTMENRAYMSLVAFAVMLLSALMIAALGIHDARHPAPEETSDAA